MGYLLLSFLAGILTVLAPCVIPILPVVLGGTLVDTRSRFRPLIIVAALSFSIIIFTLVLRATTLLIMIDPRIWNLISGSIILIFGLITIFPFIWDKFEIWTGLSTASGKLLQNFSSQKGIVGDILLGAALGPVFTSCSPTYSLIIAVILPQDLFTGLLNLFVYALGIFIVFGIIAFSGRGLFQKIKFLANPNGKFKKGLGIIFIILGLLIITGLDKRLESSLLDIGFGDTLIQIENTLYDSLP